MTSERMGLNSYKMKQKIPPNLDNNGRRGLRILCAKDSYMDQMTICAYARIDKHHMLR